MSRHRSHTASGSWRKLVHPTHPTTSKTNNTAYTPSHTTGERKKGSSKSQISKRHNLKIEHLLVYLFCAFLLCLKTINPPLSLSSSLLPYWNWAERTAATVAAKANKSLTLNTFHEMGAWLETSESSVVGLHHYHRVKWTCVGRLRWPLTGIGRLNALVYGRYATAFRAFGRE